LKHKNIALLENGSVTVPEQTWQTQSLTVFAVKGSRILSSQEVLVFQY